MSRVHMTGDKGPAFIDPGKASPSEERAPSLFHEGLDAQKHGDLVLAITKYKAALQAGDQSFDLFFNLGLCLDKQDDVEGAITAFQSASEQYPLHRPTLLHLASLHIEKGAKEESLKYWAKYQQLHA
jgi:tetratricopeptide (TPR) repeat protein